MLDKPSVKIFVSYSRKDKKWLDDFQTQITPFIRNGKLSVWDDTQIAPGANPEQSLQDAIASAAIAVLLVTPNFLASDFITKPEFSTLLNDKRVFWIAISACNYKATPIGDYEPANDSLKPLDMLTPSQRNKAWVEICKKLTADAIASDIPIHVSSPGANAVKVWNVPFSRNPFFTGREDTLTRLAELLKQAAPVAITQPAAINGIGGIGKTQTAVEYAYRHRDEYASVFWTRAENETTLRESIVEVARLLELPEADMKDQALTINALHQWLGNHSSWLLILDNADDLSLATQFLPKSHQGHVLLTTQASVMGRHAKAVPIEKLDLDDGAILFLRRSKRIDETALLDAADYTDLDAARAISTLVDGLPLALDQAGAYIEATHLSPPRYLELFQNQKNTSTLLSEYGTPQDRYHASVAVTFSLAFEQTNKDNPAIGDLLRYCAFLAPDDIPEWIFTRGTDPDILGKGLAETFSDDLAWNKVIGDACRYSLLVREANTQMLSLHRLVQLVLRNAMDESERRDWAERAVNLIDNAFPNPDFENWSRCDQLLPHAQVCAEWVSEFGIETMTASRLLNQASSYLVDRGQYALAEPLLIESLEITKRELGSDHPDTATTLNNLAGLYRFQGRYSEAEPLLIESLEITKRELGSDHPDRATTLNNLAGLYRFQGRYSEAEPLYLEALAIKKNQLDADHPSTAISLGTLALLYDNQGRYSEAEPLYLEALVIRQRVLGSAHPDTAQSLNNLAELYCSQGRYSEAEPLYLEALVIRQRVLGSAHPDTAQSLNNLALLYNNQGRYSEAEPLYLEALAIYQKQLGSAHPYTAQNLNNLALLYNNQGRYSEAEPLYLEALAIYRNQLGSAHPSTALSLNNLASFYYERSRYREANPYIEQALAIRLKALGPEHPHTIISQQWHDLVVIALQEQEDA